MDATSAENLAGSWPTADVTVIIGTYGDIEKWGNLAHRAIDSVRAQTVKPKAVRWIHSDTLADARNHGGLISHTEWLIFLDADDMLHPDYVEKMLEGKGDIRQPMTQGFTDTFEDPHANFIPEGINLLEKNWLVIGSMVRNKFFKWSGGFHELPMLEDWDFWLRCVAEGAEIGRAPGAIYKIYVNPLGRNMTSTAEKMALHAQMWTEITERNSLRLK